jgi:methylmalonyl-CoA/ethylmalonyl-CoA epimerase
VAIAVRDTEAALIFYRDRLGLKVVAVDRPPSVPVQLTYLSAGNTYLQLVEPLDATSPLGHWLQENGEGLHHICFGVDDVLADLTTLAEPDCLADDLGSGRGRPSGFLPTTQHGVRIECTEFDHVSDIKDLPGWIPEPARTAAKHPLP